MGISNGSRKIVSISLFIFLAAVTAIVATGFLFYQEDPRSKPDTASLLPSSEASIILNEQEVGKHSSSFDCWMIIDGKVYNFTSYLGAHPGGAAAMIPYCGKDGSEAFATKDQKNPKSHTDYAKSLFAGYYIGGLNQTAGAQQIQQNTQTTAQATPPPLRGGNDEYDD